MSGHTPGQREALRNIAAARERVQREICRPIVSLAELHGIDTSICEFCEEPLDAEKPWRRGLDGCGAHLKCLGELA